MIYIYDKNEVQIATLDVEPKLTFELGKLNTLEFSSDLEFEKDCRVMAEYKDKTYEFIITEPSYERSDGFRFDYFCEESINELAFDVIEEKRPSGSLENAMSVLLDGTRWNFRLLSSYQNIEIKRRSFYRTTVLEAFSNLVRDYGLEWTTEVNFNRSQVTTRTIILGKSGSEINSRLEFEKNIKTFKRQVLRDDVITALYGFGKGEEIFDEEGNSTGGYGRRIDFSELNNGLKYVEDLEALAINGLGPVGKKRHKFGIVELEDIDDRAELLEETKRQLDILKQPQVTYEISIADFELNGWIGDYIPTIDEVINFRGFIRVTKIQVESNTIIYTLGSESQSFTAKNTANVIRLENLSKEANENSIYAMTAADGKATVFRSEDVPVANGIGDLWYKPLPDGTWEMYQWDGMNWINLLNIDDIKKAIAENERIIQEAESKSQQMQEEMLAKQKEVDKAIADFEEKLANIFGNNPEFRQEIINEALKELDNKLKDIDIPQDKIDQALIEAGFDSSTIDELRQKATQTSETLEMVAEIVGSDGRTTYNKNRATVTEGELPLGTEYLEVGHNGEGFEVGKTYTISWLAECIANPSSAITYKVNTFDGVKVALELKANSPYYPTINEQLTDEKTVYGIFNDTYTLSASSDWHKEYKTTQVVSGDGEYILDLEYREIADGNLEHKYIGEWGETPTVILEGGS